MVYHENLKGSSKLIAFRDFLTAKINQWRFWLSSSHDYVRDKRNENIKIYINGRFYPRNKANISVFDSGFLLGDGVWSGIRLHNQKLLFIKEHLKRLKDDAKQIGLKIHLSKKELEKAMDEMISNSL